MMRTTPHMAGGLALVSALAAWPGMATEIYKWVDASGHVQYGDQPPPGSGAQRVETRRLMATPLPVEPASADKAGAAPADPAVEARKRQLAAKEAAAKDAQQAAEAERRAANCKNARSNLAMLQSGMRITRMDENGEVTGLSDDARAQETAQAETTINQQCQ